MLINAGSRDELPDQEGLAHFVEHTIFKGTSKRKSWHILNRMERVGGELNAYTTKEETAVYSIFPFGYLKRAAELISDIVRNSSFPEAEIKKEKSVVEEEILSYLDSPADDIYDKFDSYVFAGSSLSHNILGNTESLNKLNSPECSSWLESKFTPSRSVLFYLGKTEARKVFRILTQEFGSFERSNTEPFRISPPQNTRFETTIVHPSLHQNHNLLGIRIPGIFSEKRPTFALLSNILGGPGMNSLLNIELREKLGLVYTIETSLVSYTDCGLLTIYYGCDQREQARCDEVIRRTLDRFVKNGMTSNKLRAAKRQFIGQMVLSYDNNEQNILSSARSMLHKNKVYSIADNVELIEEINLDDLMEIASSLGFDSFSRLTLKGN